MKMNITQCVNKGMQRDYSIDKASQEFAYENKNIRITTTGDESFLSITNEKSTKKIYTLNEDEIILGSCNIRNYIVLFCKNTKTNKDIIYKGKLQEDEFTLNSIYNGNLKFNVDFPIECTAFWEAEDVVKVYWVDGLNPPRSINIEKEYNNIEDENIFNFVPSVKSTNLNVEITKEYEGKGNFPSGVVQYYITYYNKFGSESNISYASPLYYISPKDRGGEADESNNCSFLLRIANPDTKFTHLRVYSLIRTSLNSETNLSIVEDVEIRDNTEVFIRDTNIGNIAVTSTDLFYLGGNSIVASTIEQKDNTLFLGNIETSYQKEDLSDLREQIKTERENNILQIEFFPKPIPLEDSDNDNYPYVPQLSLGSRDIKGFKYLEWYRVGLQLQNNVGEWGTVLWLDDVQNKVYPNADISESIWSDFQGDEVIQDIYRKEIGSYNTLGAIRYIPSNDVLNIIGRNKNIIAYRLVVAEHNDNTRTIKSQGYVLPTLFNLKERQSNYCYSSPIWSLGQAFEGQHLGNIDSKIVTSDYGTVNEEILRLADEHELKYAPTAGQYLDQAAYNEGGKLRSVITKSNEIDAGWFLSKILCRYRVDSDGFMILFSRCTINISITIKNDNIEDTWELYTNDGKILMPTAQSGAKEFKKAVAQAFEEQLFVTTYGSCKFAKSGNFDEMLSYDEFISRYNNSIIGINKYDPIVYANEIDVEEIKQDKRDIKNKGPQYKTIVRSSQISETEAVIDKYSNEYFLDASVCNFYAPNIENLNSSDYKIRFVGEVALNNVISDYIIQVEDPVFNNKSYDYFKFNFNNYKNTWLLKYSEETSSLHGEVMNTGIRSFPLWGITVDGENRVYWMYPWQSSGGIVLYKSGKEGENQVEHNPFNLKHKIFANMWVCNSKYTYTGVFGDKNKLLDDIGLLHFNKYTDNGIYLNNSIYKGDYENLIFTNRKKFYIVTDAYVNIGSINDEVNTENASFYEDSTSGSDISIKYKTNSHMVFQLPKLGGYPGILPNYDSNIEGDALLYSNETFPVTIPIDYIQVASNKNPNTLIPGVSYKFDLNTNKLYDYISEELILDFGDIGEVGSLDNHNALKSIYETNLIGGEVLIIQNYKGDTELDGLFIFQCVGMEDSFRYLELLDPKENTFSLLSKDSNNKSKYYFYSIGVGEEDNENLVETTIRKVSRAVDSGVFGKIPIGELYIDYDPESFMGGRTDNAIELNTFIPVSDATSIGNPLYGLEGDTYYQRWDSVRVFPKSEEDVNSIVDVTSVMLETYENLDSSTRKTRGRNDITNMRPSNTDDKRNLVYSQSNNVFKYSVLDEKHDINKYPSQYWWSMSKAPSSDIDIWTQVNLNNVNTLDGDKGAISKIKRWNNTLFAFQDKAISVINFNNQTTISTENGVPVQIANSGKVQGHYYLTTNNGCKNKWSIVESPAGLYFIDSYNKSINLLNSTITPISTINLFQDWIRENELGYIWNPKRVEQAFKSFYDPIRKEVYFANGKDCLCYNELLGQFTSFYDYENLNYLEVINGSLIGIPTNGNIYKMFGGDDYCNLFDEQKDYYMIYKITKDPFIDKLWTNIEYRADVFNSGNVSNNSKKTLDTFDSLEVWNEYQYGYFNMKNAKCKFRIWRAEIPRDKKEGKGLNRIRNPWIMLQLSKFNNTNKRMEFHDLLVKYLQ